MDIQGVSALVTGAGRGIGRGIALALAREGAVVTALARTGSELDSLAEEANQEGGRVVPHVADLTDPQAAARAVEAAGRNGRLQILVNNAGVGTIAPIAEITDEQWERTLGTNLTAVFRLTRAALPQLGDGGGYVFMISSLSGQNPGPGFGAYGASKAALDYFSHCLMMEVRQKGVKVTTIAPGSVATSFPDRTGHGDEGWMVTVDDIALTVLDLLDARDGALLSRVDMRPLRPQKRG